MAIYKKRKKNSNKGRNLITYYYPDAIISEQYRTIRTNIQFSLKNDKHKTLLVTSPSFGEGKSTTVVNLGVSMAQQGEKVLIIDADLRTPTLHKTFIMDNSLGLTSILHGKCTFQEAIKNTNIESLDILTSGPISNTPAELLGSQQMKNLSSNVLAYYDLVIYDTPPVLEVTDSNILASQCDGVILVMRGGKTKAENAIEAKRMLDLSRAKIIGSILNGK